jgi:hypothetical protein
MAGIEMGVPIVAQRRPDKTFELAVAGFAFLTLLVAQWMLVTSIHGTNYDGLDGKMAQATILAAVNFTAPFQLTTISPIEGLGSQLLPLNVWVNPAFWPFHFLNKVLASDVSSLIALFMFASSCYVMARCFDLSVIASTIAAQLCIILFAPLVMVLKWSTVFSINPGNAVAYAPYMVALGFLACLEPGSWRRIALITAGMLAMIFYSLSCDPLWTMVNGISWSVAFTVVVLSPLRPKTIVLRCAALGCCGIVLFASGALEYLWTLSQYTARVEFPAVAYRTRMLEHISTAFVSPMTKYLYLTCGIGWLLGIALLRAKPRLLCVAAAMTFVCQVAYGIVYWVIETEAWIPPIPIYVEQCVAPLYLAAGVAGYWGAVRKPMRALLQVAMLGIRSLCERIRGSARALVLRVRIAAIRRRSLSFARALLPLSQLVAVGSPRSRMRFAPIAGGLMAAAIIPAALELFAKYDTWPYAELFNEPWPNEPELVAFFKDNIGRTVGEPLRGSLHFWTFNYDVGWTSAPLWINGVHTLGEYSQLVTPQALYALHALLLNDVSGMLNGFVPLFGKTWDLFFKTLQLFGVRYYVADPEGARTAENAGFPHFTLPRRPLIGAPGEWDVYEFPRPNVGDYSPTEVVIATSAPDMAAAMRGKTFDFTREVVLSEAQPQTLVPAREMRLVLLHDGFHVSARSDGTSLILLPQQFSHCLRARDQRVRILRADLLMTAVIFSVEVDTDILFDYGMFTPSCRRRDLGDVRRLQMNIDSRMPHLASNRLFADWNGSIAKLRAAMAALK